MGEHYLEYKREYGIKLLFSLYDQYSYWKVEKYQDEKRNKFERIDVNQMTNERIIAIIDDFMKGKI